MNGLQVRRAADELAGMPPRALEQHGQDFADATGIEPCLLSLEQVLQAVQPI